MTITEGLLGLALGELALESESKSEPGLIPKERSGPIGHPSEVQFKGNVFGEGFITNERLEMLELQTSKLFEWRRQQLLMNRMSAGLFVWMFVLILILGYQVVTLNRAVDSLRVIAELSK